MKDKFYSLQSLIDFLCEEENIHICLHDVTNVLNGENLRVERRNKIHALKFCNIAKSTEEGFKRCISCKTRSNIKAVTEKRTFSGYCDFGMYEIVKPVIFNGAVVCVIYLGNLVTDEQESEKRLRHAAEKTCVNQLVLKTELIKARKIDDTAKYYNIISFVESYIRLLLEVDNENSAKTEKLFNWKINEIEEYIRENYVRDIQLKQLSKLYFVNEKYLGRMFKKEMGISFNEYLNKIRLESAVRQLSGTAKSVLEIALDSGYKNVTYFNKKFKEKYDVTPTEYRAKGRIKNT